MKKLLSLLLVLVISISLCGCGESKLSKTITASNGDKIEISLTNGGDPAITVSVNGKEIYSFDNFAKYKDEYDFEKDFTDKVTDEYSDDEILWAYKFDWGTIYSTKYTLSDQKTDATITYTVPKHDYSKSYFNKVNFDPVAQKWDLVDFEIIPETGKKIFWDNYPAAQSVFECLYKTENYTLKEIDDLAKAGYSFEDYYWMHQNEFSSGAGLNNWENIYEISVDGKPFALMYCQAYSWHYQIQELDWENPYFASWKYTENGMEYDIGQPKNGDKLTDIS